MKESEEKKRKVVLINTCKHIKKNIQERIIWEKKMKKIFKKYVEEKS